MVNFDLTTKDFRFKYQNDPIPVNEQANYLDHLHSTYELIFFITADAEYHIQERTYDIHPYDLILIRPGEHHNIDHKSCHPYERFVIRFPESFLSSEARKNISLLKNAYNLKGTFLADEFLRFASYGSKIKEELRLSTYQSQLNIILNILFSSDEMGKTAIRISENIESILKKIEMNVEDIHTLDDLSVLLGKSVSSIQKIFASEVHVPVFEYIRTRKCMKAKVLLQKGTPAKAVYKMCGFDTYSTFYRAYRSFYGVNPASTKH